MASPATSTPTLSETFTSRTAKTLVSSTSPSPSTSPSSGTLKSPISSSALRSTSLPTPMSSAPTLTSSTLLPTTAASSNSPTSTSKSSSTTMSTTTSPTPTSSTPPKTQSSSTHPTSQPPSTSHSTSDLPSSSSHSPPSSSPTHSSTSTLDPPSSPSTPFSTPSSTSTSPSKSPTSHRESTRPSSTLKTTHFITTTNSLGEPTTSAPDVVTQIVTSTASNGALVTQTSIVANPTLSPNEGPSGSTFFENTGAVTGVFVLVGLSVAAICLWIFFAVRRRRRTQKLERDSAVSASLAAAGFKRTDLDDDFSRHSRVPSADLEMGQRSTLGFGRSDNDDLFDPFAVYPAALQGVHGGPRNGGYLPAAPTSPTLPFMGMATYLDQGHLSDNEDSPRDRRISGTGRTSAASYEPLLAYARTQGASPSLENDTDNRPPTPPPRNPLRMLYGSQPGSPSLTATPDLTKSSPDVTPMDYDRASEYSAESADHDDRLIPGLMRRARAGSIGDSTNDLRDDEDYSRPVLAVRNITTLTDASSSAH